jgi:hypothetical protein
MRVVDVIYMENIHYSPVWVPSTRPSIRATRQHREAVTVANDNCVIYVLTGNG